MTAHAAPLRSIVGVTEGLSHAGFHAGLAPGDQWLAPVRAWIEAPMATLVDLSIELAGLPAEC